MSLHRDTFGYIDLPDPIASAEAVPSLADYPTRLTLELSHGLRSQIDEAAAREGVTLDSWLERTIAAGLSTTHAAAA
jgi:hypothetical protein